MMIYTAMFSQSAFISMTERFLNLAIILMLVIRSDTIMSRGQPDYNVPDYTFFSIETPNSDLFSERTGFSRLDNRGRILWFDDFRNGINRWNLSQVNSGIIPQHYFKTPFVLGFNGSVRISSQANEGISEMISNLVMPVSKRLGIEFGIYLSTDFAQVDVILSHIFSASPGKGANLFIKPTTGEITIFNSSGDHSIFIPPDITYFRNRWVTIKVVADFSTGKYVRVMIGNVQYDVDTLPLDSGIVGLVGATQIDIFSQGTSAVNKEDIYLGYVIISGDEP